MKLHFTSLFKFLIAAQITGVIVFCYFVFWMAKRRKHSVSNFQREWFVLWPCIQPLKDHPDRAQCTVCNSSIGIAHQGKRDVQRHLEGSDHKRLAVVVSSYNIIICS